MKKLLIALLLFPSLLFAQATLIWSGAPGSVAQKTFVLDSTWTGGVSITAYYSEGGRIVPTQLQPTFMQQNRTLLAQFSPVATRGLSAKTYIEVKTGTVVRFKGYLMLNYTTPPINTTSVGQGATVTIDAVQGLPGALSDKLNKSDTIGAFVRKNVYTANRSTDQAQIDQKPTYVTDIASLTTLARGNVTSVTVQETNRGGEFVWKASGYTANGGTVFAASGGGYWVLQPERSTNVKRFDVKGDSLTDDWANLQKALDNPGLNSSVYIPDGVYWISKHLQLKDGTNLVLSQNARFIATADFTDSPVNGNDAGYFFLGGNYCVAEGGNLDGKGHNVGGFNMTGKKGTTVRGMTIKNWTGTRFGVGMVGAINCSAENLMLTDGVHGINGFRSINCRANGNYGNRLFSFIYAVAASGFEMNNNVGYNFEDVGLDFEKGVHCHGRGNFIKSAKNGEYAIFDGGSENADQPTMTDVVFSGNTAVRTYTYQKANPTGTAYIVDSVAADLGACAIWSLPPGATNVGFDNMDVFVERGYAFSHPQLSDKSGRSIFFTNSKVRSKSGFFVAYNSDGLQIRNSTFIGLPGSEGIENFIRDGHATVFSDNKLSYVNPKTTKYAVNLLTVSSFATASQTVARNAFINCNIYAMQVDHYNNSTLVTTMQNNDLSDDFVSNGGLNVTANGSVIMRDQPLKILLATGATDLGATVPGLNSIVRPHSATGSLSYGRLSAASLLCTVGWISYTGVIVSSLNTVSGLGVSTSSGTITLTDASGGSPAPYKGYLRLLVNSF